MTRTTKDLLLIAVGALIGAFGFLFIMLAEWMHRVGGLLPWGG